MTLAAAPHLGGYAVADAAEAVRTDTVASPRGGARTVPPRAPSRPPLTAPTTVTEGGLGDESPTVTAQGEADPLVRNGLASPSCKGALASELSASDRDHCETSGFLAAPAPTGSYGIDVHIDTGLLGGFSSGGLLSVVQDVFVTPLWMAMVWATHALFVMLEWSFTIDLLDSAAAGGLASSLRQAQTALTDPWLPLALAVASMLAAYHGLIRRRVAATIGEALLMVAMMAGGIWVMADPMGTVGALGQWANKASLGTLAVATHGTPATPGAAFGETLDMVFAAEIEAPWCYLEFGDVEWCRSPARLDSGLRSAGLAIAGGEDAMAGCHADACAAAGGTPLALEHSAELLRAARSNGAIFLALPANGPARNSINAQGSLLRVLCRSSDATNCHGPAAAQAQFRTAGQTWSRVGGLLLIAGGLLGMLLFLGFIVVRLLTAASFSLLYLLLAPAIVLAPAFGEGGRTLFRRWIAQLLGAMVSNLLLSFLLGAVLAVLAILSSLTAIGWWTQWLLMSAFWWAVYARRHHALRVIGTVPGSDPARHRSVVRRVSDVLETRKAHAAVNWAKHRYERPESSVEKRPVRETASGRRRPEPEASQSAREPQPLPISTVESQVARTLGHEHDAAREQVAASAELEQPLPTLRMRLERLHSQSTQALDVGDWRRAAELGRRGQRVEQKLEQSRATISQARWVTASSRESHALARHERQAQFLDAQAKLPGSRVRNGDADGERRNYPRLAGLAGHSQAEYERLDSPSQRVARLRIDRELAFRAALNRGEEAQAAAKRARLRAQYSQAQVRHSKPHPADRRLVHKRREASNSVAVHDSRGYAAGRKNRIGYNRS
jgi:hypothetical protein